MKKQISWQFAQVPTKNTLKNAGIHIKGRELDILYANKITGLIQDRRKNKN